MFPERNRPATRQSILPNRQVERPYKALETRVVAVPSCTVVAGQIDVSSGGEGGKTPMRKLRI
jgi:hypothetical protein